MARARQRSTLFFLRSGHRRQDRFQPSCQAPGAEPVDWQQRVKALQEQGSPPRLACHDLVHLIFFSGKLILSGGQLSLQVAYEGISVGDFLVPFRYLLKQLIDGLL
jgi:hypothetical protein